MMCLHHLFIACVTISSQADFKPELHHCGLTLDFCYRRRRKEGLVLAHGHFLPLASGRTLSVQWKCFTGIWLRKLLRRFHRGRITYGLVLTSKILIMETEKALKQHSVCMKCSLGQHNSCSCEVTQPRTYGYTCVCEPRRQGLHAREHCRCPKCGHLLIASAAGYENIFPFIKHFKLYPFIKPTMKKEAEQAGVHSGSPR